MRSWKLISGILSIVIFLYFAFSWFTTGIWRTITGQGFHYIASFAYAICVLAGGVVSIATHGSKKGSIAIAVIFIASVIPITIIGAWGWLAWSLACAIVAIVALARK